MSNNFSLNDPYTHQLSCKYLPITDKATHPSNRQEDWEYIIGFCDQVNKELEGYDIMQKHSQTLCV